ncbi:HNH endonuclease [Flavobacterium sp. A45]|uniref:HNH endonuclease n=1 Tax=Flavobacterium sp. A45 TaxID=1945862 RepID=UPI0009863765|nr:HNH endonuclease [Flavobacterium sp. A45]OOG69990.1 hypothetical protein B0E44_11675 [Flavobacterium sp. A45]
MRPLDKTLYANNELEYNPYGNAKPNLIEAIGNFCSYCEREGFSSSLDVEHIEDKDSHKDKEFLWINFLLACKNCNSIKGVKEINFENIILPHLDNTFSVFEYLESGLIVVKENINEPLKQKIKELISLIGLDRRPGHAHYSTKDDRWQERKQAWELGKKYRQKYIDEKCDIETIVDLSLKTGFWSIWMNAFEEYPEVQKELINMFAGTRKECFIHLFDNN